MSRKKLIGDEIANSIAIPESAYETAKKRYEDLATWFRRPESRSARFNPHIYPQGSFRLGTVVRPITENGEFDLDIGCRLRDRVSKRSHTQKQVKDLVGADLADYRTARRIREPLEELHRCWRLKYQDDLAFHLDAVPSIPEDDYRRISLRDAMVHAGVEGTLAGAIAEHTGAITDDRLLNYATISEDWRISNSEGYALWFESRMKLASALMQDRAINAKVGRVDDLPAYRWRSPLQACVQILKRHRDVMYQSNQDRQPISIIITTLAGHAYDGRTDIADALEHILRTMDAYVLPSMPRIPNPVNPAEDFADKWADPKCQHLDLEGNFHRWLARARRDFDTLMTQADSNAIGDFARRSFATPLSAEVLTAGASGLLGAAVHADLSFPPRPVTPSKPAGFA